MNETKHPSAIRSKQEFTGALLRLMESHPYTEITVKQIVLETDLVRKTFYRNFSSKDDVLDSILDEVIDEYTQALLECPDDPLSVIFDFCDKNRDLLRILNQNKMLYLLLLRLNEKLPLISNRSDMAENPFVKLMKGLEPDYLIAFNVGAIWNVVFKWVERGMTEPLDDVKKTISTYLKRLA